VVVAYDGSMQAARALHALVFSGLAGLGEVHVVCSHADAKVEAHKTADRAVEFLRFHDVAATAHAAIGQSPPSATILRSARELDAQLIVMGAYGRGAVAEFFLGSTTRALLEKCDRPLLLYH
ncbi:MAG: universal stress protein, partial [Planctomycetales bacterium]|nr:universal stress protein [Planctomycetales bacterium]